MAPTVPTEAREQRTATPARFVIDLSDRNKRMLDLIKNTELPKDSVYPGIGSSLGMDLDVLKSLQNEWLTKFNWEDEQRSLNEFKHYTVDIEGQHIHFIHEKSEDPNAIPLILIHGWPGSFLEFTSIIKSLTETVKTDKGYSPSFHVVVPSLPGYAFSGPPSANLKIKDIARGYNILMTEVLGYEKFAVHGTDQGSLVGYNLLRNYTTVGAAHMTMLPFYPPTPDSVKNLDITLSPLEEFGLQRTAQTLGAGMGYFAVHTFEPNTIGLALYDNPIGLLSWIGDKYIKWTDPEAPKSPSALSHEILRSASMFFLTKSFVSSLYTYAQNPFDAFPEYFRLEKDTPILFSNFKWNVVMYPEGLVKTLGNLVHYRCHEIGGHIPGLDNPEALLQDLRAIAKFWNP